MEKSELIMYTNLNLISALFTGIAGGLLLTNLKVSGSFFFFLFLGLIINLINNLIYRRKFQEFIKS